MFAMKSQGVLMTAPGGQLYEETFQRVKSDYNDLSDKFKHKKRDFSKQYAHIYSVRLAKMKKTLIKRVADRWGEEYKVKRLADLQDEGETGKCVVIGTIYKNQELRPSVLKELSEELQIVPQPKLVRFVDDKDTLILEDELQRIRLVGNIEVHSLVTGVVAAVLGEVDNTGKFNVDQVCFPGPESPSCLTLKPKDPARYLVLLSGLDLAAAADSLLPLRMFTDWVTGWLGGPTDQHKNSRIALVLIAGNLLRGCSELKEGKIISTNVDNTDIVASLKLADDLLAELAETVHVELMPGEFDPTNYTLPQQPIHYTMFPKASAFSSLHNGTNPHSFQVENRIITGCSGQSVADVGRYSSFTDPIKALKTTFHWGHLCPTAPDSLSCYPYYEEDPFIMENQPDIYFSANHDKFQTKIVTFDHGDGVRQDTRMICVPSFNQTKSCVVVNLSTLDCEKVSFSVGDLRNDMER